MTDMMKEFGFGSNEGDLENETGTYPTIIRWACTDKAYTDNGGGWSSYEGKDENDKAVYKSIKMPEKMAIDMPNFKRGYRKWVDKVPTDVLAGVNDDMPDAPADDWEPVIIMNMYSPKLDFVTFASSSKSVIRSVASLFNAFKDRTETAPHLVPFCTMGEEEFSTKHGTFHVPTFKIHAYSARPPQLMGETVKAEPKPIAKPVAKPVAKPEPVADEFNDSLDVMDDDDDRF
tara:strand:+ start:199 stop:891 length:693 start_codon:yes stop_codon:yes gene_type:complete